MNILKLLTCLLAGLPLLCTGQSFSSTALVGESINNPTSLQFGPDGRLYVSQQDGLIHIYTVVRSAEGAYSVVATELVDLVQGIANHNDDGQLFSGERRRQVTGLVVTGTAAAPVLYVSSSDYRIGGGGGGGDVNLDTNSGTVSRLILTGTGWKKIDLVRGLPRSEQNHATNGLQLSVDGSTLYLAQGGHTNAGSPSNNFAFTTEYALSAAILAVDLMVIEALPTLTDAVTGAAYKYDLPTLDDPTRANVDGKDTGDPFGGNDGLNQAVIVPGGPVRVHASGFRNPYDLVLTEAGRLYTWDNGPNGEWGGHPDGEGSPEVTSNWVPGEPGSTGPGPNDARVRNRDNLHLVSGNDYYGGHPNPIRASPTGAGLYTNASIGGENGIWRNQLTDAPATTLPTDWPPVPPELADVRQADFQNPGIDDPSIFDIEGSTNGLTEYRASNFDGALTGHLLAASFTGKIYRVKLNAEGSIDAATDVVVFAESFGATPLDVTAQGDGDPFPGTVWAATYGDDNIRVFEPEDYASSPPVSCNGQDVENVDDDGDTYTNADEIDNGTDPCNAASRPADFDQSYLGAFRRSDLNDPDDDDDGLLDTQDPYAIDADNGLTTNLPLDYPFLNGDPGTGFYGLGFTGLMSNGKVDYLEQIRDEQNSSTEIIAGGAVGLFTLNGIPEGTASGGSNSQRNAFQFGLAVDATTPAFTLQLGMIGPVFPRVDESDTRAGFYIGSGTQDDYLQYGVYVTEGRYALETITEIAGKPKRKRRFIDGLAAASQLDLYIHVFPAEGRAEFAYRLEGGGLTDFGYSVTVSGALLNHLTEAHRALAVGLIANRHGKITDLSVTYDYLRAYFQEVAPVPSTLSVVQEVLVDGTETILATNVEGNQSITITGVSLSGPGAATYLLYEQLPYELPPGESFQIELSQTGFEGNTLTVEHDGLNGPRSSVAIIAPARPAQIDVTVRAKMLRGISDELRLRLNDQDVHTWNVSGADFQDYTTRVPAGDYNLKVWFADNRTDIEVDYLIFDGRLYETEEQPTNTAAWQDKSCGGSYRSKLYCRGYVEFEDEAGQQNTQQYGLPVTGLSSAIPAVTSLRILPNPTAVGSFSVAFSVPTADRLTLAVYDSAGRRIHVREWAARAGSNLIEVASPWPPGLYSVVLSDGRSVQTERVVVR